MSIRKMVVELDVSELDESIEEDQIRYVCLGYYNVGEAHEWEETVPHKVLKVVRVK